MTAVEVGADRVVWSGAALGLATRVALTLDGRALVWRVDLTAGPATDDGTRYDVVHAQDLALAPPAAALSSEPYVCQYLLHRALEHPDAGTVLVSRQTMSAQPRLPLAVAFLVEGAVAHLTDSLQVFTARSRRDGLPHGLLGPVQPGVLQYEYAMPTLVSRPLDLSGGTAVVHAVTVVDADAPGPLATHLDEVSGWAAAAVAAAAADRPTAPFTPTASALRDAPPRGRRARRGRAARRRGPGVRRRAPARARRRRHAPVVLHRDGDARRRRAQGHRHRALARARAQGGRRRAAHRRRPVHDRVRARRLRVARRARQHHGEPPRDGAPPPPQPAAQQRPARARRRRARAPAPRPAVRARARRRRRPLALRDAARAGRRADGRARPREPHRRLRALRAPAARHRDPRARGRGGRLARRARPRGPGRRRRGAARAGRRRRRALPGPAVRPGVVRAARRGGDRHADRLGDRRRGAATRRLTSTTGTGSLTLALTGSLRGTDAALGLLAGAHDPWPTSTRPSRATSRPSAA